MSGLRLAECLGRGRLRKRDFAIHELRLTLVLQKNLSVDAINFSEPDSAAPNLGVC